jgi:hypothetical protein
MDAAGSSARRRASWRRWHRWLAGGAAVFMLLVTVTGLLLNHADHFGLGTLHIRHPWLLARYGLTAPEPGPAYRADGRVVGQLGRQLFVDEQPVDELAGNLAGAVGCGEFLIVVSEGEALLLTADGQVADRLTPALGLPPGIQRLGSNANGVVVEAEAGFYTSSCDLVAWLAADAADDVRWVASSTAPPAMVEAWRRHYLGDGITWERLILDLHSGRFLGGLRVLAYDLFGIAVLLAIVGGLLLLRRGR